MEEIDVKKATANISGPCPWHRFLARASADGASLQDALSNLSRQMLNRPWMASLLAGAIVPLGFMMTQRRGRKLIFDVCDTAIATVLLILLLMVVLGLPVAAAYLVWFLARTVVSHILAQFAR